MYRMVIKDQKYGCFGILYQRFEEANENVCIYGSLNGLEAKLPTGRNSRDHVDAEATAGIANHRRLSDGCPSGTTVVVRTYAGLVAKMRRGTDYFRFFADLRVSLFLPLFHRCWFLLVRSVQWLLRCQSQVAERATDRHITEPNIEFLPDQLVYTPPSPQGKAELQLVRGKAGNPGVQSPNLLTGELFRAPRNLFRFQRFKSTFSIRCQPFINPSAAHAQRLDDNFWAFAAHNLLDSTDTKSFESFMIQLTTVSMAHGQANPILSGGLCSYYK